MRGFDQMIGYKPLYNLSDLVKKELDNQIIKSENIELKQRLMIVKLYAEGVHFSKLAKLFNKSELTIKKYIKIYYKDGLTSLKSSKQTKRISGFAICIKNDDYLVSLEIGKIYQMIFDAQEINLNLIRIIDETGEDYLYPQDYFIPISLPLNAIELLTMKGQTESVPVNALSNQQNK